MSIIMISSELPEVLGMSDRVYVVASGRIAGELPIEDATQERSVALGARALGHSRVDEHAVVVDADGPRFDSCSADTDRARDRILAAGKAAGAEGATVCTVGLGVSQRTALSFIGHFSGSAASCRFACFSRSSCCWAASGGGISATCLGML